jgi:hypothetical protein
MRDYRPTRFTPRRVDGSNRVAFSFPMLKAACRRMSPPPQASRPLSSKNLFIPERPPCRLPSPTTAPPKAPSASPCPTAMPGDAHPEQKQEHDLSSRAGAAAGSDRPLVNSGVGLASTQGNADGDLSRPPRPGRPSPRRRLSTESYTGGQTRIARDSAAYINGLFPIRASAASNSALKSAPSQARMPS